MILVTLQGTSFNITVIQVYAPISNAEEPELERFYEDLQNLIERTNTKQQQQQKDVHFIRGD